MRKMMIVLMGLVFTLVISGCGGDGDDSGDKNTGTFTVKNSSSSTFRIVKVIANEIDETPSGQVVPGNGIHKGGQHSYTVEACDKIWVVDVIYNNDPESTRCEQVHRVPCGGNRDFVFNNTTC